MTFSLTMFVIQFVLRTIFQICTNLQTKMFATRTSIRQLTQMCLLLCVTYAIQSAPVKQQSTSIVNDMFSINYLNPETSPNKAASPYRNPFDQDFTAFDGVPTRMVHLPYKTNNKVFADDYDMDEEQAPANSVTPKAKATPATELPILDIDMKKDAKFVLQDLLERMLKERGYRRSGDSVSRK
jgi:hypothetical protein